MIDGGSCNSDDVTNGWRHRIRVDSGARDCPIEFCLVHFMLSIHRLLQFHSEKC